MRLNELYAKYKDQVQFYIIYDEPTTDEERTEVASACQIDLDLHMPMLVDPIDNDIDNKYVGLPMRLFLVDAGGKIAFAGEKGPSGWDDEAFEEALKELIA